MGRWFAWLLVAAFVAAPAASMAGERLDAAARQELLRSGKAQQFVDLPLGTMHVRVDGPADGDVVLLIHGGVVGGFGFEKFRQPLAAGGYRVIVPDLLGYGYSDRPNRPYTRQFYVEQIEQLLDALHVQRPVAVVGASLGGAIATAFTADAPERVRCVALLAPAGGGQTDLVNPLLLWPVVGDTVFHFFGAGNLRGMMDKAYAHSPDRQRMLSWMDEQIRFSGFAQGVLNTLRNYDAAWQPEDYRALGKLGLPVLAVWGTADTVNPFAQSHVLKELVPQMQVQPLEGSGHAITFGETDRVLQAALPFLECARAVRPAAQAHATVF